MLPFARGRSGRREPPEDRTFACSKLLVDSGRSFMLLDQLPEVIEELVKAQISVRSNKVSASSMSTPRYRTVFSMLVCPSGHDVPPGRSPR